MGDSFGLRKAVLCYNLILAIASCMTFVLNGPTQHSSSNFYYCIKEVHRLLGRDIALRNRANS